MASSYPLSNQQLLESIRGTANEGLGYSSIEGLLQGLGYTPALIKQQLAGMGYSKAAIQKITTAPSSLLKQLGMASFFPVGGGVLGTAGAATGAGESAAAGGTAGAAGGAAGLSGAAGKALSSVPGLASGLSVASLFSNSSLWAGLGMSLLGTALILFGIVKLSGGSPSAVAGKVVPHV